ncbi:MAG: hypothetical protein EBS53_10650, partial [Bacteroidetes bacterium]|nr:hypothetical protein [Bacteroidota bacterium]
MRKFLPVIFFLFSSLTLLIGDVYAQNYAATIYITNSNQVSPNVYEFDVYLKRDVSSTTGFLLNIYQFGIGIDTNVLNGGQISVAYVANSSQLNPAQQPFYIVDTSSGSIYTLLNVGAPTYVINGKPYKFINSTTTLPPGFQNATPIPYVNLLNCANPGVRIGRFRIVNSQPFKSGSKPNHIFATTAAAGRTRTYLTSYVGGFNSAEVFVGSPNPLTVANWDFPQTCDPNLTFDCTDSSFISQSICSPGAFVFNGQTITNSGIYFDTLLNVAGCDSIIKLNLTVNQPSSSSMSQTICAPNSYV